MTAVQNRLVGEFLRAAALTRAACAALSAPATAALAWGAMFARAARAALLNAAAAVSALWGMMLLSEGFCMLLALAVTRST